MFNISALPKAERILIKERKQMINAMELAHSVQDYVVEYRRDLHRHPELSMQEFRTTDRICEELDKMGVSYRRMKPTEIGRAHV